VRKVLILFGILDDSDVAWLGSVGRILEIPANTVVIYEGEPIDAVFVLLDGICRVNARAAGGREIARLLPGEVFGEMSFVDSRPPSASVTADQPSQLLAIPRSALTQRISDEKPFAARFYQALAIFLGARLRTTVLQLGYSGGVAQGNSQMAEDEIDPESLERLSAAGLRFDDLQRRLRLQI
jgi:CRP/FNR family transcriptional regulator, cyclic AMP receptor protein